MRNISRRELAAVLITNIGTDKQTATVAAVAQYVAHHGGAKEIDLLIKDVEFLAQKQRNHAVAHVHSARKLSPQILNQVVEQVQVATNTQTTEVIEHLDTSLLGGVIANTPEMDLDVSLRGKLNKLQGETNA